MIFLGLASNYHARDILRHSFAIGSNKDYHKLETTLATRYGGTIQNTSLVYSGRTAISLALKSLIESNQIEKNDFVAVNSFTCFAVIKAIKHAGLNPVFIDLEKTPDGTILPNYSAESLESTIKNNTRIKAFILQNTFGQTVNIESFLKVKEKYNLSLIEDLAHCTGRAYQLSDNTKKEVGTVGDVTCLSFGKGKSIDTITGGAIIIRNPSLSFPKSFNKSSLKKRQKTGDVPRASWYPVFGAIARGLSHLHLEKPFLAILLKLRWIERSADTKLDESTTITNWQAKLANRQLNQLKTTPLREYFLVKNREDTLQKLKSHGIRLEESWYEVPVSPKRYYSKINFPEEACPNATFFSEHVINLPTWYHDKKHKKQINLARKILKENKL